jgi:hypothetical protein
VLKSVSLPKTHGSEKTLKIAELDQLLSTRRDERIVARLGDMTIADDASVLQIGSDVFTVDDGVERNLANYLKIPTSYLAACPPEFKAQTMQFWQREHAEADTVIELTDGHIVSIHSPETLQVPMRDVVRVAEKVFDPEAEVRYHFMDENRMHLDVTTAQHQVDVQSPVYRQVGDITQAGLRFLAYPNQSKSPSVGAYMERLVCTNGMTTTERAGQISLQGRTVDEVIEEMEQAARRMLGTLDDRLARYAGTAQQPIPGNRQAFAHQLAREANLPRSVLDAVMELVNQLPDNATLYDMNQAFTSIANTDVTYATRTRLQNLGGYMAFEPERIVARCGTCQHPLDV